MGAGLPGRRDRQRPAGAFLNIIDEYTREALATRAARSFTADATIAVLDELATTLGRRPEHVRMDNGPELTAYALQDWCRFTATSPACIDPGSPRQNGVCESFSGRLRDEFLVCEQCQGSSRNSRSAASTMFMVWCDTKPWQSRSAVRSRI